MDICRKAGNPTPTWRLDAGGDGLRVRFPFSETYQPADAVVPGNATGNSPTATTQKSNSTTQNAAQKSSATTQKPSRDRIVDCLKVEPMLTRTALAERVGLSPDGVKYHLQNLKASGVIWRVGADRAGHWEVLG